MLIIDMIDTCHQALSRTQTAHDIRAFELSTQCMLKSNCTRVKYLRIERVLISAFVYARTCALCEHVSWNQQFRLKRMRAVWVRLKTAGTPSEHSLLIMVWWWTMSTIQAILKQMAALDIHTPLPIKVFSPVKPHYPIGRHWKSGCLEERGLFRAFSQSLLVT